MSDVITGGALSRPWSADLEPSAAQCLQVSLARTSTSQRRHASPQRHPQYAPAINRYSSYVTHISILHVLSQ